MAAAGIDGADRTWMQIELFEAWLEDSTRLGGRDDQAGTVLVWRDLHARPTHAAVTLGGGYLLHKPSQGWMSPIKVLTISEGKYSARTPGHQLTRRQLV
jgi:cell wall-associated NlpC family hydrolase